MLARYMVLVSILCGPLLTSVFGENTSMIPPTDPPTAALERDPSWAFVKRARTNGVYTRKTVVRLEAKPSLLLQQDIYAGPSNVFVRVTSHVDKDNILARYNEDVIRNIVYEAGRVFDWIEGQTNGTAYPATTEEALEYVRYSVSEASFFWGTYEYYTNNPGEFDLVRRGDTATMISKGRTEITRAVTQICVTYKPFFWISSIDAFLALAPTRPRIRTALSFPKEMPSPPDKLAIVPQNLLFEEYQNCLLRKRMPHM